MSVLDLTGRLLRAFGQTSPTNGGGGKDYLLVDRIDGSAASAYAGVSGEGNPSVLFPLTKSTQSVARLTSGMSVRAWREIEFSFGGLVWRQGAAVLECVDAALLPTFCAISASLIGRLTATNGPTWPDVVAAFEEWERLLRRRHQLDSNEELGLWGELWLISASRAADYLVAGWRGPEGDVIDFVMSAQGFEVKTSRTPFAHFVSHAQVDSSLALVDVYFVSLLVIQDPVAGRSLPELVAEVLAKCTDPVTVERQLLDVGYSKGDATGYSRRYRLGAPPAVFPREEVPRVHAADPGVSRLRYHVQLDRERSLDGAALADVLENLGLEPTLSMNRSR